MYYNNYNYGSYGSDYATAAGLAAGLIVLIVFLGIIALAAAILTVVGQWKTYKKAGKEGYIALIPVYNVITEMELAGMPIHYWFLNYGAIIPCVGWICPLVFLFWKNIELAKAFGKGAGTGVLMSFFPFVMYPIFGFSKNISYVGPNTTSTTKATSSEGKFCGNCGTKVAKNAKKCSNCGKEI